MKGYITIAGLIMLTAATIIFFAKLYPVAIVDGSPIWYRTWDRYFKGTEHALEVQARSAGTQFSPETSLLAVLKKDTLSALIEDEILTEAARKLFSEFDTESEERIHNAIKFSQNMGEAAQLMYGFGVADFHDLVLLPQSHLEVIKDNLSKQKIDFPAWLAGIKKKAHVRFFLNSYRWDGDRVK